MTTTEKLNHIKWILETNPYKDLNADAIIKKYLDKFAEEEAGYEIPREHLSAYKLGCAEAIINYLVKYILGDIKKTLEEK